MREKLLILITAFLFIIPFNANASHYMGGEITWECMPNGNYRFTLKMYRECNGIQYSNNTTLNVDNHPSVSSISMTLVSQTDISPKCNPNLYNISCSNTWANNSGAIEEWIWVSDVIAPNGINLPGVPPAEGWIFSNSSCCRNPCTNIPNSNTQNWYLRAIMYNYNGRPAGVCDDNSPIFLSVPSTAISSGYPNTFYLGAQDIEFDSLSYTFSPALSDSITDTIIYHSGYSYLNPLPSPLQYPINISPVLNQRTGELNFTSYTTGAFVVVVSVKAYKQQQIVAEVIREFQIVILPTGYNLQPQISAPFISPSGAQIYADTVIMGDLVNFNITGIDTDSITIASGRIPQTVSIEAYGTQFDTNYISQGCNKPPCATLSPAPRHLSAATVVATNFNWQTSSTHITSNLSQSYDRYKNVYNFLFVVKDDYCPVPQSIAKNVTITIVPRGLMPPPIPRSTEVEVNGDVKISWERAGNSSSKGDNFDSYIIYHSNNKYGPYIALDSLSNFWNTNTSFIHQGANAHIENQHYYFLRTVSLIQDSVRSFRYMNEKTSDTISLINISLTEDFMCDVRIEWNDINQTPLNVNNGIYYIYKTDHNNVLQLFDSTSNSYYIDTTSYIDSVEYAIGSLDTSGNYYSISPKETYICTHVSIIENNTEININIFPNPAQNIINFEQYSDEDIRMEIYDANGRLVKSTDRLNNGLTTINISNLASGIYSVKFESENNTSFKKIVIE